MGENRGEHEIKTGSGVTSAGQGNAQQNAGPEQASASDQVLHSSRSLQSDIPPSSYRSVKWGMDKDAHSGICPAGYGKSTLVSRWLKETGIPSAWLSLDAGDNDPTRFLQYLLTAFQPVAPGIGGNLPDMLQGASRLNLRMSSIS